MADARTDLVSIDDAGVVRPVGKGALQQLRARKGVYRLVPGPAQVVLLRHQPDDHGAPPVPVRLAGEVGGPGALCDVVALIARSAWRGELIVVEGEDKTATRVVFFDAGSVIGARSDAVGERLGEIMYRLGALTAPQVQSVMARLPFDAKRRFGETAVDLGFLDREQLFHFAARQTEEIFYALLRVARGAFYFVDHVGGVDDARLAARVHLPATALLGEGVARMDELKYFRERIPSHDHVPSRAEGRVELPAELVAARPAAAEVWTAIDGKRSVLELGRALGRGELDVTQLLFQLVHGGFVTVSAPAPSTSEALVAIFNDAMKMIHDAASKHGRAEALAGHLATYRSGVGVLDEVFAGAGPRVDGTVDAASVARNIVSLAGDDPVGALAAWLHEYVAFALFDMGSDIAKSDHLTLSRQVRARLALLAPKAQSSMPPAARGRSAAPGAPHSVRGGAPPRPPPRPVAHTQRLQAPMPAPSPAPSRAVASADLERGWTDPPPPNPQAPQTPLSEAPILATPPPLPALLAPLPLPSPPPPSPPPPPVASPSFRPLPFASEPAPPLEALALAEAAQPRPSQGPAAMVLPNDSAPPPAHLKMSSFPPGFGQADPATLPDDDFADAGRTRVISAHAPARRRVGLWVLAGVLLVGTGLAAFGFVAGMRTTANVGTEPRTVAGPRPRPESMHPSASSASATEIGTANATVNAKASGSPAMSVSASATPSTSTSNSAPTVAPIVAPGVASIGAAPAPLSASAAVTGGAPSAVTGSSETTLVRTTAAGAGHRVFVDGRVVGEGPGPLEVPCGRHAVKVGSGGKTQSLDLPCGGETTLTVL